jgi:hypothetical protein
MSHFKLSDKIVIDDDSLLNFMSGHNPEEWESFIVKSIESILNTQSSRTLILDSWLVLDYTIRQIIIWGVGANSLSHEEFDLRYELLPLSFKSCLTFLNNLKKYQHNLPINPDEECLKLPIKFWKFLKTDIDSEKYKIILDVIDSYNEKMNPTYLNSKEHMESISVTSTLVKKMPDRFRTVDSHWINVTSNIDDQWIKKVKQINNARNSAAHSYDEEKIFSCFGINGQNKLEVLRQECLNSISILLKIKIIDY